MKANICSFFFTERGDLYMNSLTFENHDAYLLYQAALERNPNLSAKGNMSVRYALFLYYRTHPEERPRGYRYTQSA